MTEHQETHRKGTSTSNFGVSRRESHDSAAFYARFSSPSVSEDAFVHPRKDIDQIFCKDARSMDEVEASSVALVVTSPPYFAGKEYEEALGSGLVPKDYLDYLSMLEDVFAECVRKLEPGGRIAVNVANLGRRPYRSLSSDVIDILQNRLHLLLRGEVIWQKARGASGSCAWGSFQRPANPVLRDLTERVIIASKGRFDRALTAKQRYDKGLPSETSIFKEEFMEATTDVWEMPSESATRVGHPAPFPVQLPERLIHLYTYRGDLILDPFMGSGTTAVAAVRTDRHFAGYETDSGYTKTALARIHEERARLVREAKDPKPPLRVEVPAVSQSPPEGEDFQARSVREGKAAREVAEKLLDACGFVEITKSVRLAEGVEVNFRAVDVLGRPWFFDVSGAFSSGSRPGLRRTDTLWKALGKAAVLHETHPAIPLVLLTTNAPEPGSSGDIALQLLLGSGKPVHDVIELLSPDGQERLRAYAEGAPSPRDAAGTA